MIEGKCHCRKSSFQFLCHCNSCRSLNGGGHLSGAIFAKSNFESSGPLKSYKYSGGSDSIIDAYFCENCGNHLFAFPSVKDDIVVIKANTFEDESNFNPSQSIFTDEKFHWDQAISVV